jgi:hypothetical protein
VQIYDQASGVALARRLPCALIAAHGADSPSLHVTPSLRPPRQMLSKVATAWSKRQRSTWLSRWAWSSLARSAPGEHPQRRARPDAAMASRSPVPDTDNTRVGEQVTATTAPFAFLLRSLLPALLARLFGRCLVQPAHPPGSDTGGAKVGRFVPEKGHARLVSDGLAPTHCLLAPTLPVSLFSSPRTL